VNPVEVYVAPPSGECTEALEIAAEILLLRGPVAMRARARQQLMAVLLNVVSQKLSPSEVISEDGATVSQAITHCDHLIDDPGGDHETAKDVAEWINQGDPVPAGVIPLGTEQIAYRRAHLPGLTVRNYPNPFSSRTEIRMFVPGRGGYVVTIHDLGGRLIRRFEGLAPEGTARVLWDGTDDQRKPVAPGVYFYRVRTGDLEISKRMVLMR
jgi:hypothetical protein